MPLAVYVVALFAHGAFVALSATVQVGEKNTATPSPSSVSPQDIDHRNASLITRTQKQASNYATISTSNYCGHVDGGYPYRCFPGTGSYSTFQECQDRCTELAWCIGFSHEPGHCAFMSTINPCPAYSPNTGHVATTVSDLVPSSYNGYSCYGKEAAATPAPTPATPSPASAVGDPHLQNIHGERFDLMKQGNFTLIQIPRGVPVKDSMLTVEAYARRLGASCAELYFQTVSITGKWARSDIHFRAGDSPDKQPMWLHFGPVEMKVVHGRAETGQKYLNIFVKHLGRASATVGGLLGEDDHADAATPNAQCLKTVSLANLATRGTSELQYASVAIAAL